MNIKINQRFSITTRPDLVEAYIKKEHLTKKQLADRCGVSPSTITRILSGNVRFQTANLLKVLDVVGLKFEEFYDVELYSKQ